MTHLSPEQISEWLLGTRSAEAMGHIENCSKCREDIIQLQEGIYMFRQWVHKGSEHPQPWKTPAPRTPSSASWTLAAATALAVILAVFPLYLDARQARLDAEKAEDSLLLDRVQVRLNRTVPRSMERLMELMSEGKEAPQ